MLFVVAAISVSPVPGRSSDLKSMLSLTSEITNKDPSWSSTVPVCQWKGVLCTATGSVFQIAWGERRLGGFANLTTLPDGLLQLTLDSNQLTGNPNLASLPHGLQVL